MNGKRTASMATQARLIYITLNSWYVTGWHRSQKTAVNMTSVLPVTQHSLPMRPDKSPLLTQAGRLQDCLWQAGPTRLFMTQAGCLQGCPWQTDRLQDCLWQAGPTRLFMTQAGCLQGCPWQTDRLQDCSRDRQAAYKTMSGECLPSSRHSLQSLHTGKLTRNQATKLSLSHHITTQLFAASFRRCALASFSPLKRFLRMKDLCRPKLGLSPSVALPGPPAAPMPVVPADDSAATSITSFTLRWDVLAEVSEYTRAPMCLAVFRPCTQTTQRQVRYYECTLITLFDLEWEVLISYAWLV